MSEQVSGGVLDAALVPRVRQALAGQASTREVTMFGGLAFMVDERMVVCVRSDRDLLVRAAADRADELLAREGARPAEMGAGRSMGRSWISVAQQALSTDEDLHFWIGVALEHRRAVGPTSRRGSRQRRSPA
jgi:TfoX/Sxy family transcriptional regulator of competence genes